MMFAGGLPLCSTTEAASIFFRAQILLICSLSNVAAGNLLLLQPRGDGDHFVAERYLKALKVNPLS